MNIERLCQDLENLVLVAGPTQASVKMSPSDPRINHRCEFPATIEIQRIVERMNQNSANIEIYKHSGNLILVTNPSERSKIKEIPVTLGAHLDEITFIVSHKKPKIKSPIAGESKILIPLCKPPRAQEKERNKLHLVPNPKMEIIGFRDNKLVPIGEGLLGYYYGNEETKPIYSLNSIKCQPNRSLREGDMVIQRYGPLYDPPHIKRCEGSILRGKALDDRVGCVAILWALQELSKQKIPAKAVLTTSEEGVPADVSWGRLVRPAFKEYCRTDGVTLICDGIDGKNLDELKEKIGTKYVSEAVIVPYTSDGKGGGDIGIFSALRDYVVPEVNKSEDRAITSTDYVSRSFDPKIMDDFPLIGFVSWVNGKAGDSNAICHEDEAVEIKQIVNIIHTLVYATAFFDWKMASRPNSLFG